jgi:hypothetical protein
MEIVVFTANGDSSASGTSSTNSGDGVAVKTNSGTNVFNCNIDQADGLDSVRRKVVLVLDRVAALDRTSVAVPTVGTTLSRGSGNEGQKGGGNEDDGFGEHDCCIEVEVGVELKWFRMVELGWRNREGSQVVFIRFDCSSKSLGKCVFFFFSEALHISITFHRLMTPINSGVERKNDEFFQEHRPESTGSGSMAF